MNPFPCKTIAVALREVGEELGVEPFLLRVGTPNSRGRPAKFEPHELRDTRRPGLGYRIIPDDEMKQSFRDKLEARGFVINGVRDSTFESGRGAMPGTEAITIYFGGDLAEKVSKPG